MEIRSKPRAVSDRSHSGGHQCVWRRSRRSAVIAVWRCQRQRGGRSEAALQSRYQVTGSAWPRLSTIYRAAREWCWPREGKPSERAIRHDALLVDMSGKLIFARGFTGETVDAADAYRRRRRRTHHQRSDDLDFLRQLRRLDILPCSRDPNTKKHDGITLILFDMTSSGVSTKPILLISGLQHERAMISGMGERVAGRPLGQIAADSIGCDERGLLEEPLIILKVLSFIHEGV